MRHCRYTTHQPEGDVALRLRALWVIISAVPAAAVGDDRVLADDRLLNWVAAAGSPRWRR